MSTDEIVIRARALCKVYRRVHEKPMLLREALFFLAGRSRRVEELWALRDINFEVRRGQALGLLGRNGSGKSTLLQIAAGTSFPSQGTLSTRGRVSMLLSLGSGLNPEMTGEENVFMKAGLIGLSLDEARRRLPSIVRFAELEAAIDTPIKYYSSGMTTRLAFSIAINVDPNVIVIDEVFGVGDIAFQSKCQEEMWRLKSQGATIMFASQSPPLVAEFCSHAIWLDNGVVKSSGAAREVASQYAQYMEELSD